MCLKSLTSWTLTNQGLGFENKSLSGSSRFSPSELTGIIVFMVQKLQYVKDFGFKRHQERLRFLKVKKRSSILPQLMPTSTDKQTFFIFPCWCSAMLHQELIQSLVHMKVEHAVLIPQPSDGLQLFLLCLKETHF